MKTKLLLLTFLGFSFFACEKDACDLIQCDKGQCVNGVCVCEEGYTGPSCAEEKEPARIYIKEIKVAKMPEKKGNGDTWDIQSQEQNPDLMLIVWRRTSSDQNWQTGIPMSDFGGIKSNHDPSKPALFTYSGEGTGALNFPSREYRISMYDNDGRPVFGSLDEFMGGVTFKPHEKGNGFPNPLILENAGVKFEVEVEYEW